MIRIEYFYNDIKVSLTEGILDKIYHVPFPSSQAAAITTSRFSVIPTRESTSQAACLLTVISIVAFGTHCQRQIDLNKLMELQPLYIYSIQIRYNVKSKNYKHLNMVGSFK